MAQALSMTLRIKEYFGEHAAFQLALRRNQLGSQRRFRSGNSDRILAGIERILGNRRIVKAASGRVALRPSAPLPWLCLFRLLRLLLFLLDPAKQLPQFFLPFLLR